MVRIYNSLGKIKVNYKKEFGFFKIFKNNVMKI